MGQKTIFCSSVQEDGFVHMKAPFYQTLYVPLVQTNTGSPDSTGCSLTLGGLLKTNQK